MLGAKTSTYDSGPGEGGERCRFTIHPTTPISQGGHFQPHFPDEAVRPRQLSAQGHLELGQLSTCRAPHTLLSLSDGSDPGKCIPVSLNSFSHKTVVHHALSIVDQALSTGILYVFHVHKMPFCWPLLRLPQTRPPSPQPRSPSFVIATSHRSICCLIFLTVSSVPESIPCMCGFCGGLRAGSRSWHIFIA